MKNLGEITDAAKLLIMAGIEVRLVMGDPSNIKLTNAFDLRLANLILAKDA